MLLPKHVKRVANMEEKSSSNIKMMRERTKGLYILHQIPKGNTMNIVVLSGRLSKDPVTFDNKDGSKKIIVTVASPNEFVGKDGERGVAFIEAQAFVPAGKTGIYPWLHKGDHVELRGEMRNNNWTGADGVAHYEQIIMVRSLQPTDRKQAETVAEVADVAAEVDTNLSELL